ncbi:hypothetical protein, partial [Streptomyces cyaneofuscatus]
AERADVDRVTAVARAALGAAAFSEAYERGARLDPEEAGRQARTAPTAPSAPTGVRPIRS